MFIQIGTKQHPFPTKLYVPRCATTTQYFLRPAG